MPGSGTSGGEAVYSASIFLQHCVGDAESLNHITLVVFSGWNGDNYLDSFVQIPTSSPDFPSSMMVCLCMTELTCMCVCECVLAHTCLSSTASDVPSRITKYLCGAK